MKNLRHLALIALAATFALTLLLSSGTNSVIAAGPFRCTEASFVFPVSGIVGWTHGDPAGQDLDAQGYPTVHTGVDVFADEGHGAFVHAPADGYVSRQPGAESVNIVIPGAINVLNGEVGIELYLTHMTHGLAAGQPFRAGDIIGLQYGDHVHFSVGAFIGYDDREIEQTQDPSPYFQASLAFSADRGARQPAPHWCWSPATSPVSTAPAPAAAASSPAQEYVVQSGDTLGGIAATFGVSIEEIAATNGIVDVDSLSVGQKLMIRGSGGGVEAPTAPSSPPPAAPPAAGPSTYVVEPGDTLFGIAERFGTDVDTLIALNNLTDPDVLAVGDTLQLP
jgi:LysM repeat protein